jgi:hypothetical protein
MVGSDDVFHLYGDSYRHHHMVYSSYYQSFSIVDIVLVLTFEIFQPISGLFESRAIMYIPIQIQVRPMMCDNT